MGQMTVPEPTQAGAQFRGDNQTLQRSPDSADKLELLAVQQWEATVITQEVMPWLGH